MAVVANNNDNNNKKKKSSTIANACRTALRTRESPRCSYIASVVAETVRDLLRVAYGKKVKFAK